MLTVTLLETWMIEYLLSNIVFLLEEQNHLERYLPQSFISYTNSNFAKDPDDPKSVTRYCFFIKREIITWYNKQQKMALTLISEAKYIVMSQEAREKI